MSVIRASSGTAFAGSGRSKDSGAPDTYPGYFESREMIAMVDAGIPPADVIKAATSVPAAFLGDNDHGTLAVGKVADFLLALDSDGARRRLHCAACAVENSL